MISWKITVYTHTCTHHIHGRLYIKISARHFCTSIYHIMYTTFSLALVWRRRGTIHLNHFRGRIGAYILLLYILLICQLNVTENSLRRWRGLIPFRTPPFADLRENGENIVLIIYLIRVYIILFSRCFVYFRNPYVYHILRKWYCT